jgi:DNA-binding GntR family transcriptional regulator
MASRSPEPRKLRQDMGFSPRIYASLRRKIILGQYHPGQRLVEGKLAKSWGVSKSPLREALKELQHEGLVEAVPRRGYIVTPITIKQVQDLFDLRLILEREAAVRAARSANPGQLEGIRRFVGTPYVPGNLDSHSRFLAQNKSFHLAVARLTGNQRLVAVLEHLLDELERLFHLGLDIKDRAQDMVHEHEELVAAIQARDLSAVARTIESQIENSRQMVLEGILAGSLAVNVG